MRRARIAAAGGGALRRPRPPRAALAVAALLLAAWPLPAQESPDPRAQLAAKPVVERVHVAEPFAPAGHWSRDALHQLAAAGLLEPASALSGWPLRRSRIRALLAGAVTAAARAGDADATALARELRARFAAEFPVPGVGIGVGGRLAVGRVEARGRMRGGASRLEEGTGWVYPGPRPVPDASRGRTELALDVTLLPALAAAARGRWSGGTLRAREAYVTARVAGLDLWAGRRTALTGGAAREGIVLSGGAFDGIGVEAPGGGRLPGPLRRLGPVRGALLVARMERSGPYARPWFSAMRIALAPHPSLSVGLNRAVLFGGEGNEAVTPRRVLLMTLGYTDTEGKDSDFENQVASLDVAWRARALGRPVLLYGEWGFDDIAFAWTNVPGVIAGVEAVPLARVPGLAVGIEHVWFDRSCCGHPPWYRHGALAEGWTDRGVPLGHPLGGHGRESALRWRLAAPGAGLVAAGRLFARRRGAENLYAPDRAGASHGGALRLVGFVPGRLHLRCELELERGRAGWWSGAAAVGVEIPFRVGG